MNEKSYGEKIYGRHNEEFLIVYNCALVEGQPYVLKQKFFSSWIEKFSGTLEECRQYAEYLQKKADSKEATIYDPMKAAAADVMKENFHRDFKRKFH